MKAPLFDYLKPTSLIDVFTLLEQHGDKAKIIAGGQSLLATLNMRLSEPKLLIDISGVPGLSGISLQEKFVRIGAMTRHSEIEESILIERHMPLLSMTAPMIAHKAIRNRGTLGGSISYADPASEWPCCAVTLDAVIVLGSKRGLRRVTASDYFLDLYTTDIAPDEIVIACEFPLQPVNSCCAYDELARRQGDFPIVGLATIAQIKEKTFTQVRLTFIGVGNIPVRAKTTELALEGKNLSPEVLAAAKLCLSKDIAPTSDIYNSADMKLHLAAVLMSRILTKLTS